MPSAYFGLNNQAGTGSTVQVRRYNGLSASTIGTAFGLGETADVSGQSLNRVIQFGSQNTFLAFVNSFIYRSTDAGTTWAVVATIPAIAGSAPTKTGLYVIYINGIPTVCCLYMNSGGGFWQGSFSTDGITWTNSALGAGVGFGVACRSDTVFRNTLYTFNGSGVSGGLQVIAYSPGGTTSGIALPSNEFGGCLCVFNDTLLYFGTNSVTGARNLCSLDGGAFQIRVVLDAGVYGGDASSGMPAMFVDSNSGDLIVMGRKTIPGAWGCWRVDSSYAVTDISSTVLPPGMLSTSSTTTARTWVLVDGEFNPGTNPDKYIIYASSNVVGTLLTMYKWEGVSTVMTNFDSGGNIQDAVSMSKNCQGIGFWTNGENSIGLEDREPVSGGIRLYFKLYSTGGATVVNVRTWFGTQNQEYPLTQGTISDNSAGAIGANINTGLTADNGVTTYFFTWNSTTDGVDPGERYRLILEVFA